MAEYSLEEKQRLQAEWTGAIALRDTLNIAYRQPPTYQQTIAYGGQLSNLYNPEQSLLLRGYESPEAREYREKAKAFSLAEGKEVTPLEIIDREIQENDNLLQVMKNNKQDATIFEKRKRKLRNIREEFSFERYVEGQLIERDVFQAPRNLPISKQGKDYKEFVLPHKRALRIRMLHPNKPEQITGADVIYELYTEDGQEAYITAVQYKLFDDNNTLYSESDPRLAEQLKKMKRQFCDANICETPTQVQQASIRFPSYCSAFLRVSEKLQPANIHFVSSGNYIPVCRLEEFWEKTLTGNKKLSLDNIRKFKDDRSNSVPHGMFEEAVKNRMIGSRRLGINEIEELYREFKILKSEEHIIIHAQDYSPESYETPRNYSLF